MKTNLNFTLANFQDHSGYLAYFDDCPCCGSVDWTYMYETDLAVDGKVVGKASSWQDGGAGAPRDVNFTLDGTTWYKLTFYWGVDVTKRLGEDGESSNVPKSNRAWLSDDNVVHNLESLSSAELLKKLVANLNNTEYDDVMLAYERLKELVEAVAAKEPPKQS